MKINGLENLQKQIGKYADRPDPTPGAKPEVLSREERIIFSRELYRFLTSGNNGDTGSISFLEFVGKKDILWRTDFSNMGTDEAPILWAVEGVGDQRRASLIIAIPTTLRQKLQAMHFGETEERMTPWHQELLNVFGDGDSGHLYTFTSGDGKQRRFSGVSLNEEDFTSFMASSETRLTNMIRDAIGALTNFQG